MSGRIGRIDPFNEGLESWDAYSERLGQYFICNEVKAEKKVPALLSLVGGSTYALLRGLTAPKKPSEETFDRLVALLKEHYNPKPLVIAERFRFHKREQREGETIREYIAEIRKLSEYCEFGATLADALRDRLVCGLKNENIQRKLLSEADLTYDRAVELSVAMETAAKDAIELRGNTGNVNKIYKGTDRPKTRKNTFKTNTNSYSNNRKSCYRCTGNHDQKDCKLRNETCYKCGKRGHIKKACRSKVQKTHSLETEHEGEDEYDDYIAHIELVNVNSTKAAGQDSIWVMPKINGQELKMELDTGSSVFQLLQRMCTRKT
ncbi:uncharacterized protein [Argopecten irradians]|uniref:uncharacterized protein n=1 Tax=Argopecten irradians TaxID=31199 RepID=UPI003724C339